VIEAVDHNIDDYSSKDTVSTCWSQERLTLPAQSNRSLAFFAAYSFGENLVLNDDLNGKEAEVGMVGAAARTVGMLEEIRG
jgi:hypothetical protein